MDISLKQAPLDPAAWSDRELHAFARGYLGLEDGDTLPALTPDDRAHLVRVARGWAHVGG